MRRVVAAVADPALRDLVVETLTLAGFSASAHADSASALSEALADWPDAAVLDVAAPGLPALHVCRVLRAAQRPPPLPVVLLAPAVLAPSTLAAGAEDTLIYPFSPTALVLRLDELLAATDPPPP